MKYIYLLMIRLLISGCEFPNEMLDNKFGEQNFVSAVSAIELHKTRNGSYPENLDGFQNNSSKNTRTCSYTKI